jgi:hypothetical protein
VQIGRVVRFGENGGILPSKNGSLNLVGCEKELGEGLEGCYRFKKGRGPCGWSILCYSHPATIALNSIQLSMNRRRPLIGWAPRICCNSNAIRS